MKHLLLVMAAVMVTGAASAAQPLGRLFFTPGEREQLDVTRTLKQKPQASAAAPETAAPEAPPPPQIITYNGIVRRSDGKSILWLNSRPVDEKDALSGLAVSGRVRADGAVVLDTQGGGRINLKVGQRAELHTGRVGEARPEPKDSAPKAEATPKDAPAARPDPAAKAEAPARPEPQAVRPAEPPKAAAPAADKPAEAIPPQYARDGVPHSALKRPPENR